MKTRKFFIIATIVLLVGIVCLTGSLASVGFDLDRITMAENYERKEYRVPTAGLRALVVEDDNTNVRISGDGDDDIRISYGESEHISYAITAEDGTLSIRKTDTRKWWERITFDFGFHDNALVISVPQTYAAAYRLETSNGEISAQNLVLSGDTAMTTNNNAVTLENITGTAPVTANTSNGSVVLTHVDVAGDFRLNTSNAEIRVADSQIEGSVDATTSNGMIHMQTLAAGPHIRAKTSNAAIVVDAVEAAALEFDTSNGRIRGTLPGRAGDYTITSSTSNGSNSLPQKSQGGDVLLQVNTSNAAIDIQFAE